MPSAREQFHKLCGHNDDPSSYATTTPGKWQSFRAMLPRPPARDAATHSHNGPATSARPDAVMLTRLRQYMADNEVRHFQLTGERLDHTRPRELLGKEIERTDPELLVAYIHQPGTTD